MEIKRKYHKALEALSLGFWKPPRTTPDVFYEFMLARKKFYDRMQLDRVALVDPQLIFGHSPFTDYLQRYYYDQEEVEGRLLAAFGHFNKHTHVFDIADFPHMLVSGRSGSGKTRAVFCLLLSLMWLNLPKWLRVSIFAPKDFGTFKKIANVFDEFDKMREGARALVKRLKGRMRMLNKRQALSFEHFNAINQDRQAKYEVVVIDEFFNILKALKKTEREEFVADIQQIAGQGRSLGIHLIVMTQYPLADSINSTIRSQLEANWVFRLKRQSEAQVAGYDLATRLKPRQSMFCAQEDLPIWTPTITDNQVGFFVERIRQTMEVNGWSDAFKSS